jgi:hypothetical protein
MSNRKSVIMMERAQDHGGRTVDRLMELFVFRQMAYDIEEGRRRACL